MAFSMMSHALRMLWANLGNAARVSVVPIILMYVVLGVVGGGAFMLAGGPEAFDSFDQTGQLSGGGGALLFFAIFGLFFIAMAFFAWVAISWHRFILLEEYPQGWLPPFRWTEIKGYVWKLILLSLVFMVIAFIPMFVIGIMAGVAGEGGSALAGVLLVAVVVVLIPAFLWISFRLSSVLPATAIEKPMGLGEAWRATQSHSGTIFWFGLVYVGVSLVIQLALGLLGLIPVLGIVATIFGSWFTTILGFSALTTVYGVAVEGRELT
ncbi:MAG: hypothetical protein AAGI10_08540 [Pseudomonadota bacterium]